MNIRSILYFLVLSLSVTLVQAQDSVSIKTNGGNTSIVFLLDVSHSMGNDNKMLLLKKSTEELLKLLDRNDQISLISFGTQVNLLYHTSSYTSSDSLQAVISKIRCTASSTNINGAIYDAYDVFSPTSKKQIRRKKKVNTVTEKHVLLITDGLFELNPYTKQLVCDHPEINLTCVIVGKGEEADKAVIYVREELQLRVTTLVDEEKDVKKLADLLKYPENKKG